MYFYNIYPYRIVNNHIVSICVMTVSSHPWYKCMLQGRGCSSVPYAIGKAKDILCTEIHICRNYVTRNTNSCDILGASTTWSYHASHSN